jgi:hypothetical protein
MLIDQAFAGPAPASKTPPRPRVERDDVPTPQTR